MADVIIETQDSRLLAGRYNWLRIGLAGALVGLVVWVLGWLIASYIVDPLVCRTNDLAGCVNAAQTGGNIAAVIGAILGSIVLIRMQLRRPMLVSIAALAVMWGLVGLTEQMFWLEAALWSVFLYAVAYLLFSYLARIRNVTASLIIVVLVALLVLAVRWISWN